MPMTASREVIVGRKLTGAMLAELVDGQVVPVSAYDVMSKGHVLAIGVPGAFTPVCSEQHVPAMVQNASRLRRSGYDHLVCIVACDPFVTDAWANVVDPGRSVRFISDGNLNFAKWLGLVTQEQKLFLGDRSQRYMLSIRDATIETVRIEAQITDYACTKPDNLVLEGA